MAYRGYYQLEHPEKYLGKTDRVRYLSLWERNVIKTFDRSKYILQWVAPTGNMDFTIPYISPVDGMAHRYIPDFMALVKQRNGELVKFLIEVKPENQTKPPKLPKSGRKTKKWQRAMVTYAINRAKWDAARLWCEKNGFIWKVMTEVEVA